MLRPGGRLLVSDHHYLPEELVGRVTASGLLQPVGGGDGMRAFSRA